MNQTNNSFKETLKLGLIAGVISLSVSVIGMVELFSSRDLIADVLSLGQVFLFAAPVAFGYIIANNSKNDNRLSILLRTNIIRSSTPS